MSADFANQLKARGAVFAALVAMILAPSAQALNGNNVTEEFHKTVSLNASGRVSLENINGNVEITGWDRNEVQIDAAVHGADLYLTHVSQRVVLHLARPIHRRQLGASRKVVCLELSIHQVGLNLAPHL